MYGKELKGSFFYDTPPQLVFFRDDVITHTILSVKGQLDGKSFFNAYSHSR